MAGRRDFYEAENRTLKESNSDLAKALTDLKIAYKEMVAHRDMLQQENFILRAQLMKLIKDIDISSSNYIAKILQLTNSAAAKLEHVVKSPLVNSSMSETCNMSGNNKAHAVKPMIDGHVIFNPRINLRRLNETPQREVAGSLTLPNDNTSQCTSFSPRSMHNNSNNTDTVNICRSTSTSDDHDELADGYTHDSMEDSEGTSPMNNFLDTVPEEEEHLQDGSSNLLGASGSSSKAPLLSGVFRDARVGLFPNRNTSQCGDYSYSHINTERGLRKTTALPRRSSSSSSDSLMNTSTEKNIRNTFKNDEEEHTLENSFKSSIPTSLLSSTVISSPSHASWINTSKRRKNFNNSSNDNEDFHDCPQTRNKCRPSPSINSHQQNVASSINTDYDPLEGPSTLLDSQELLESLPVKLPSEYLRETRAKRYSNQKQTKITQRKTKEERKPALTTKVANVMLTRKSLSGSKNKSLNKNPSGEKSRRSSSQSPRLEQEKTPDSSPTVEKEISQKSSTRLTLRKIKKSKISNENTPLNATGAKKSKSKLSQATSRSNSTSNSESHKSPERNLRPRRAAKKVSLKEPTLKTKMRRSK